MPSNVNQEFTANDKDKQIREIMAFRTVGLSVWQEKRGYPANSNWHYQKSG